MGNRTARNRDINSLPLELTPIVTLDFEATGLNIEVAEIIEVAAIRCLDGKVCGKFESLVRPSTRIPPASTRIHGISDQMVEAAPSLELILSRLLQFIGESDVLAGYFISLDIAYLHTALTRAGHTKLTDYYRLKDCICIKTLARSLLPQLPYDFDLARLARELKVPVTKHHRAMGDVEMSVKILSVLLKTARATGVETLGQLLNLQGKPVLSPWEIPGGKPEYKLHNQQALKEWQKYVKTKRSSTFIGGD